MGEVAIRKTSDVAAMAEQMVASRMFGNMNEQQAMVLMLMAEAEGKHPMVAMQDYDVINGRAALKAQSMMARFQQAGGHVKWIEMTDEKVVGEFSHETCAPHPIEWTMDRARKAGIAGKDTWKKYPRQMLRARVIGEGVRSTYPACLSGAPMYVSEEVQDIEPHELQVEGNPGAVSATSIGKQIAADIDAGEEDGMEIAAPEADPYWDELVDELTANCGTRQECEEWLKDKKKDTRYAGKHHTWRKHFYQTRYLPLIADLPEVVG